jgi:hypothetical protein
LQRLVAQRLLGTENLGGWIPHRRNRPESMAFARWRICGSRLN